MHAFDDWSTVVVMTGVRTVCDGVCMYAILGTCTLPNARVLASPIGPVVVLDQGEASSMHNEAINHHRCAA